MINHDAEIAQVFLIIVLFLATLVACTFCFHPGCWSRWLWLGTQSGIVGTKSRVNSLVPPCAIDSSLLSLCGGKRRGTGVCHAPPSCRNPLRHDCSHLGFRFWCQKDRSFGCPKLHFAQSVMPSTWAKKSWDKWERYPYDKWSWSWDSWEPRSFGQKTWQSKSEKTHAKSDNGVEQNDKEYKDYKESRRAELPERTEKKEVRRNETIESVKDSDDSKDPKVEGKGVPEKPTDEAASGLKGRFGKLSLSEGKSEEASDNWSLQPDYMYDPGWFAWNTEMAWAFGAEASDEWQGKFPWDDWEKKENPTNSADPETSEQLASEWERPTAPGFGSFGKRHELVPKKANLKEQFEKTESKSVTTLMLRNVPNAYDRETLMEELDQLGFAGCFNFLYLPIDSATKNNVGYAFVNFNDEKMSEDCMNNMTGYFFKGQPYNRRRAAIVSVAHLQGLEANLEHYSRTQATPFLMKVFDVY